MTFTIPELSLVVLIGPSGCGKSTFARRHFKPTEVMSSDAFRALVSDDENDQSSTDDAFAALHFVAARRLARGKLTVVDATNVQPEARKPLVALAREYHVLPVAIVLDLPERVCHDRNRVRPDRDFGAHVVRNQKSQLRRSIRGLGREGFRHVHVMTSQDDVEAAVIERQPLWNNRKHEAGPFDIIGDVHGCCDELEQLLQHLGYDRTDGGAWSHPGGRKAIFVGDLVDRGPRVVDTLKTVMSMSQAGSALAVPGNHDIKLKRKLEGRDVTVSHGLDRTLAELDQQTPEFRSEVQTFLDGLVSHYVFDSGHLVVAHAGMKAEMQGRGSGKVRDFALFGETTGETDAFGLPVRHNWAAEYRGRASVVYGHTPVPDPEWLNRTINIDTGCVFGGKLTALRWPEKELVSVPALHTYADPIRPFLPDTSTPTLSAQQTNDDLLDIDDVRGKRLITTRLHRSVTIREENAAAALEVMSRFAANPKWLIYLPPTMSPSETSKAEGLLEHPAEAFGYYRSNGVPTVVLEQKHMGSRAIVIVCRSQSVARERFGVLEAEDGICYTRTGRRFFEDASLERELLASVRGALDRSGFWEQFNTDWVCLDCELMPWSAKALELVRQQYASVGTAARVGLGEAVRALEAAGARGVDVGALIERHKVREELADRFARAYRNYCWPVESLRDIRIAPFHVMATEGAVHSDKDHVWHMTTIGSFVDPDHGLLIATRYRVVDLSYPESESAATAWWTELTENGGEGAVVKPLAFLATGSRGLLQPAVKCRGKEYLRIIYGPEYTLPEHLGRLRQRGLSGKRSLALREFALGIEGLERFVQREPLRRVHECVFGVLALESEPVDPRL
ncbi:MAG: polynucleotide kinase-phosphatase [Acidobacteria bacterium]|nr:polynucleotide kinase-phosphatase [Acidobacteriota bacterium]